MGTTGRRSEGKLGHHGSAIPDLLRQLPVLGGVDPVGTAGLNRDGLPSDLERAAMSGRIDSPSQPRDDDDPGSGKDARSLPRHLEPAHRGRSGANDCNRRLGQDARISRDEEHERRVGQYAQGEGIIAAEVGDAANAMPSQSRERALEAPSVRHGGPAEKPENLRRVAQAVERLAHILRL